MDPISCNATLDVGGALLGCSGLHRGGDHYNSGIRWRDTSPGATPARPSYFVHENYRGQWFVIRGDGTEPGDHVVCFEPSHPDARCAARAEAERLNNPPVTS